MKPAVRVVMNTGFLYGKMLISIIVSLFSTRLVLDALGASDYGIFQLVAGVIAMLTFLNSAMSISTQRYLSYYLGAGVKQILRSVFNSSVILHLIIGLTIVLILEGLGIILFNGVLNIPEDRIGTAQIVYHFMVISTFFTINAVPYDASINAHEHMFFDALTGIFESFMKLGIAIWLINAETDRLILYGLLIALLTILIRIMKSAFCFIKYEECRLDLKTGYNYKLLKEMFSFAGWNLFGSFCILARNQGLAIILNVFFGVIVNAAYGIAHQVNGQISAFSRNMLRALDPQIVKSEGSGDRERMLRLASGACKYSFILLAFFAIPLIIEMPYVLELWLKEVPKHTVLFCQLVLVISLIESLTVGIMRAIQSVGKIKRYQTVMGSLLLLNLPLAVVLIKLGFQPQSVLIGAIAVESIAGGTRVWFAQKLTGLKASVFFKGTILRTVTSFILTFLISLVPSIFLGSTIIRVGATAILSTISLFLLSISIVLTNEEISKIKEFKKFIRNIR